MSVALVHLKYPKSPIVSSDAQFSNICDMFVRLGKLTDVAADSMLSRVDCANI
jgi:hypothetical protein